MAPQIPVNINFHYNRRTQRFYLEASAGASLIFSDMRPQEAVGLYNMILTELRKCVVNADILPQTVTITAEQVTPSDQPPSPAGTLIQLAPPEGKREGE